MKTVLLTGGAGFIGSHLAEMYLQNGYYVVVVDNLITGNLENLKSCVKHPNFNFVKCDITNRHEIHEVIKTVMPDIINHHAAQKSVADSVLEPEFDAYINVIGLLNIITALKDNKIESFIFSSSGGALSKEIIGNEKSKETDAPSLKSPYAITKYASENYIKFYADIYGFNYTILRYANVYGPRQHALGECGVVPIFVSQVLNHQESKIMTYSDMPNGCTRDYVYIKDVTNANLLATKNPINSVINISSGNEISMLEIYKKIVTVFDGEYKLRFAGPRLGDIKRSVLDHSKAFNLLGWGITYSFEDGLKEIKNSLVGDYNAN